MPQAFNPLTPPFDPVNPPSDVTVVPDTSPTAPYAPTLNPGKRYLLKPSASRTHPIHIAGGGDIVIDGGKIKIGADGLNEILRLGGGDTGRILHIQNLWCDPNGHQIDLCKTNKPANGQVIQWKNMRSELIWGSKTGTHADLLQASGGYGEIWIEDFHGDTAYQGFQEQQEATLTGTAFTITGATRAANVATFTCPNHTLVVGDYVEVNSVSPSGYNGGYQVGSVSGSGTSKKFSVTLGDLTPAAYSSGGTAQKMTFTYTCGDFHVNRVSVTGHASPGGASNNPPEALAAFRIGARTASTSGPSTGSHPGEDQTPITDVAWSGVFDATDFYITPPPNTANIGQFVEPDSGGSVYSVIRPVLNTVPSPDELTWPNWDNVANTTKVLTGPHPLGDAVQIVNGVPVPAWVPLGPVVALTAVSAITTTGATLNGTVNPNGHAVTDWHFDYGTTTAYGSSTSSGTIVSGSSPVSVNKVLTGLTANTVYHYRLKATTSAGTTVTTDGSFQTSPATGKPILTIAAESSITTTGATLNGTINPNGSAVSDYHFDYGLTTAYGSSTTPDTLSSGSSPVSVNKALTGLSSGTTYHYRLSATNTTGTTVSADHTFQTSPAASTAVVSLAAVTNLGQTTATLNGTINPSGSAVSNYHFQYDTTTAYTHSTTTGTLASGSADVAVAANITGLTAGTVYLYRLVVTNSGGTVQTTDGTFTTVATQPANPPTVMVDSPADQTIIVGAPGTTVSVFGTVVADGSATIQTFTVNGSDVSIAGDDSFTTSVALATGSNTITLVATDDTPNTTTVTLHVTLATTSGGGTPPVVISTDVEDIEIRIHQRGLQ